MSKFNVGEIVYLNSGSPPMTIVEILKTAENEEYDCSWIKSDGTVELAVFDEECITKEEINASI